LLLLFVVVVVVDLSFTFTFDLFDLPEHYTSFTTVTDGYVLVTFTFLHVIPHTRSLPSRGYLRLCHFTFTLRFHTLRFLLGLPAPRWTPCIVRRTYHHAGFTPYRTTAGPRGSSSRSRFSLPFVCGAVAGLRTTVLPSYTHGRFTGSRSPVPLPAHVSFPLPPVHHHTYRFISVRLLFVTLLILTFVTWAAPLFHSTLHLHSHTLRSAFTLRSSVIFILPFTTLRLLHFGEF